MTQSSTFVIVGGGLGGAKAAEALRDNDFSGQIVLLAQERHLPYERPPLSKEFLHGKKTLPEFTVHDAAWYSDHEVDLRVGRRVASIDRAAHTVVLHDDTAVQYDKLLLATGSRSRHLPIPGSEATGIHYLRTIDDAQALDSALTEGSSLAVIGAGWIGLEVAASARDRGGGRHRRRDGQAAAACRARPEVGTVFAQLHRDHGVELLLGAPVAEIATRGGSQRTAARGRNHDRRGRGARGRRRHRIPSWPSTPAWTWGTAGSSSTRRCAAPIPTSTRPATLPRPSTRCSGCGSGSSTGPTR